MPEMQTLDLPPSSAAELPSHLLLVDDEPSVLNALRRLFRAPGYRILQATSGADALALLAEHAVDLVISDMRMPQMDGAALLEAVRLRDPSIVRILLTGYADIGSTVAAINRGAIHRYIAKPWDDQDMLLVVREALVRRGLELRNAELQTLTVRQNSQLQELNQQLEQRVAARTAELEQVNAMLNKSYEELNGNFKLALTVFSGLLEMRQDGIAGHSRRVSQLAALVGARLGMDARAQQELTLAGLLHDIGQIGFPDRMLGKPVSTYAPDELLRYRRHTLDGESALLPLGQLHGVARIVRQHHERYDGHGFPDGLAGTAITLAARIVAAVSDHEDLLDGTLAERRYTAAMAVQALSGGAGTRYDPAVVDALQAVLAAEAAETRPGTPLDVRQLKPGMVLAQDLLSAKGVMLLAAGYVFEARVIRQIGDLAQRENLKLTVMVRRESADAVAVAGVVA